jgi:tRNA modification GTPase
MSATHNNTIFALSSGRPPAAIAVVRISGPQARLTLEKTIGRVPAARQAAYVHVRDPNNNEIIDEALALWFPGPNSETGEDVAELQLHGGRAVVAAVVDLLSEIEGLRQAEPGEFTRRAFENGKLDLTAVEGLADLISAETEAQRRQAYRQLKGLLGDRAETWRRQLIEALALVEARIDFSDEADVPEDLVGPALTMVRRLREELAQALAGAGRGERLRDGLVVAIAGPPNAGKSTLLNRLARRDAAIVSPIAGTTRDVIEVHFDLEGYPVTLLDTAGISESEDPIEQEGVRRARQRASEADLVIWVEDCQGRLNQMEPQAGEGRPPVWHVQNKIDANPRQTKNNSQTSISSSIVLRLSALTGQGVEELVDSLCRYTKEFFGAESGLITRKRHRQALETTKAALDRALSEGTDGREDIIAEELRFAAQILGKLTGRIDVEDILNVIFQDFCIGK